MGLEREILQRGENQELLFGHITFKIGITHPGGDYMEYISNSGEKFMLKKLMGVARIKMMFKPQN